MLHSTSLNSIPPEILSLIAAALPFEDRYAGTLICKGWSTEFTAAFYRSVTLRTNRQCDLFYNNALLFGDHTGLAVNSSTGMILGHYVREVRILASEPSPTMLKQLPRLCPLLKRFELPDTICGDIHDLGSLPLYYTALPALTHVSMVSDLADFSWLKALPRLVSLHINWIGAGCSLNTIMNTLPTWCPRLETLKLTVNSPSSATLQQEINTFSPYHNHDYDLSRTEDISQEEKGCAPTMQSVQLCVSTESANSIVAFWLAFCGQKYPNLRHLALIVEPSYVDDGTRLDGENIFFNWHTHEDLLLSSIVQIAQHCRHLESVEFENFTHSEFFLRSISHRSQQCQQLTSIKINDQRALFSSDMMSTLSSQFQNSLATLSLAYSHYTYSNLELNHDALLQYMRQLRQLSSLTLGRLSSIPVDVLLDAMPQLKHLCLVATYPDIVNAAAVDTATTCNTITAKKHGIEILEFKRNIVPERVLKFINRCCISLRQLHFEQVSIKPSPTLTASHGADYNKVYHPDYHACSDILLPNLDLKKICLRDVSCRPFLLDTSSRVGVIQTSISSDVCKAKWYDTGKRHIHHTKNCKPARNILGYTAFKSTIRKPLQEEDDMQGEHIPDNDVFSLLIECRSIEQIYFNDNRLIL